MLALMLVGCIDYGFVEPTTEIDDVVLADTGEEYDPVPIADAPVYANSSNALYEVEPGTGTTHFTANFWNETGSIQNFVDIAIDLDGRMYGGTYDTLYSIDPTNGFSTVICRPPAEMTALTFTSEGVLVAGGEDRITLVDVETCKTEVLLSDSFWETSGDLVGLPDGFLYWTVVGENGGDELVKLDPNTGMTQWIGAIGHGGLYGLGYDDGELFGFSSSGTIVAISPEKASSRVLGNAGDISWWGATTNPVIW
jgi:hypothetical protein